MKKFNAFEGKRYKDYDNMSMKKIIFHKKKFVKCDFCPKKLRICEGFWGYNHLLCKKCYIKICKSDDEAVSKMLKKYI